MGHALMENRNGLITGADDPSLGPLRAAGRAGADPTVWRARSRSRSVPAKAMTASVS
jgi:hypothetical protein